MASTFDDTVFDFDLNFLNQSADKNQVQVSKYEKQRKALYNAKKKTIATDSLIQKYYDKKEALDIAEKSLLLSKQECTQICIENNNVIEKVSKLENELQLLKKQSKSLEDSFVESENRYGAIQSHAQQLQTLVKNYETEIEALKIENQLDKLKVKELEKKRTSMEKENETLHKYMCLVKDIILGKKKPNQKCKDIFKKFRTSKYDEGFEEYFSDNEVNEEQTFEELMSPSYTHNVIEAKTDINCNLEKDTKTQCNKLNEGKINKSDNDSDSGNDFISVGTGRESSVAFSDSDKCFNSPEYDNDDTPSNGVIDSIQAKTGPAVLLEAIHASNRPSTLDDCQIEEITQVDDNTPIVVKLDSLPVIHSMDGTSDNGNQIKTDALNSIEKSLDKYSEHDDTLVDVFMTSDDDNSNDGYADEDIQCNKEENVLTEVSEDVNMLPPNDNLLETLTKMPNLSAEDISLKHDNTNEIDLKESNITIKISQSDIPANEELTCPPDISKLSNLAEEISTATHDQNTNTKLITSNIASPKANSLDFKESNSLNTIVPTLPINNKQEEPITENLFDLPPEETNIIKVDQKNCKNKQTPPSLKNNIDFENENFTSLLNATKLSKLATEEITIKSKMSLHTSLEAKSKDFDSESDCEMDSILPENVISDSSSLPTEKMLTVDNKTKRNISKQFTPCLETNSRDYEENNSDNEVEIILKNMKLHHSLITPLPRTPTRSRRNDSDTVERMRMDSDATHTCKEAAELRNDNKVLHASIADLSKEVMNIKDILLSQLTLFNMKESLNTKDANSLPSILINEPMRPVLENSKDANRLPSKIINEPISPVLVNKSQPQCVVQIEKLSTDLMKAPLRLQFEEPLNLDHESTMEGDDCESLTEPPITLIEKDIIEVKTKTKKKPRRKLNKLDKLKRIMFPKSKIKEIICDPKRSKKVKNLKNLNQLRRIKPSNLDSSATLNDKETYEKAVKVMTAMKTKQKPEKCVKITRSRSHKSICIENSSNNLELSSATLNDNETYEKSVKVMKTKQKSEEYVKITRSRSHKSICIENNINNYETNKLASPESKEINSDVKITKVLTNDASQRENDNKSVKTSSIRILRRRKTETENVYPIVGSVPDIVNKPNENDRSINRLQLNRKSNDAPVIENVCPIVESVSDEINENDSSKNRLQHKRKSNDGPVTENVCPILESVPNEPNENDRSINRLHLKRKSKEAPVIENVCPIVESVPDEPNENYRSINRLQHKRKSNDGPVTENVCPIVVSVPNETNENDRSINRLHLKRKSKEADEPNENDRSINRLQHKRKSNDGPVTENVCPLVVSVPNEPNENDRSINRLHLKRKAYDAPVIEFKRTLRSSKISECNASESDKIVEHVNSMRPLKEDSMQVIESRGRDLQETEDDIHVPVVDVAEMKSSILCKMIDKYAKTNFKHYKKHTDVVIDTYFNKFKTNITEILEMPSQDSKKGMDKFVNDIKTHEWKHVILGLLKYLQDPERKVELYNKIITPPAPAMTKSEMVLIYIIAQLKIHWKEIDLIDMVLSNIEYTLFKLNMTPVFEVIESMSHFYAVVCRYFRLKSRLRLFMLDAMYCIQFKSIPLIKQCLEVWMHVIPLGHLGLAKCPLVRCLVFLLHFYKAEDRYNRVQEMRNILHRKYSYEASEWTETKILDMFKNAINGLKNISIEKKMLRTALIILGKRQGTRWCQTKLVKGILIPVIENKNGNKQIRNFCISMLGPLLKPYPIDMKVHCEIAMNMLLNMLKCNPPVPTKEAIFTSLIFMSRHNQNKVMKSLLTWSPDKFSPEFESIMRDYVRERTAKIWLISFKKCLHGNERFNY